MLSTRIELRKENKIKFNDRQIVTYHCAAPYFKDKKVVILKNGKAKKHTPTHTIMFYKQDDKTVVMTFAAANTKHESFSKKIGNTLTINRLNSFLDNHNTDEIEVLDADTIDGISEVIPQKVNNTLSHYVTRMKKYFKLTDCTIKFRYNSTVVYGFKSDDIH